MSSYVIPTFILLTLIYGFIKKVNIYESFVAGSKEAIKLIISILPYLIAIFIMVELYRASNLANIFTKYLATPLNWLGIPKELSELIILRPFSGNGSIALLEDIYQKYTPDSYISRCASVIAASSDTIFYISAVYFSGGKVKNLRFAIPVALIATFFGTITACFLCKFI